MMARWADGPQPNAPNSDINVNNVHPPSVMKALSRFQFAQGHGLSAHAYVHSPEEHGLRWLAMRNHTISIACE